MHGATVLGADDEPMRPAILWNDSRAHEEAAELDAEPSFRAITGNIVFPGFTAPKLVWLARHEPEIFARIKRVLLPKDYLRLWLTGEAISDMSDSGSARGGLMLASARGRQRSCPTAGWMPPRSRARRGNSRGTLRKAIAERFGLPERVVCCRGRWRQRCLGDRHRRDR